MRYVNILSKIHLHKIFYTTKGGIIISIAAERQSTTLGAKGPVKLKNPPARKGRSILRTFSHNPLNLLNPGRSAAPQIKK